LLKGTKRNFLKYRPEARTQNVLSSLLMFFVIEITILKTIPSGMMNADDLGWS